MTARSLVGLAEGSLHGLPQQSSLVVLVNPNNSQAQKSVQRLLQVGGAGRAVKCKLVGVGGEVGQVEGEEELQNKEVALE